MWKPSLPQTQGPSSHEVKSYTARAGPQGSLTPSPVYRSQFSTSASSQRGQRESVAGQFWDIWLLSLWRKSSAVSSGAGRLRTFGIRASLEASKARALISSPTTGQLESAILSEILPSWSSRYLRYGPFKLRPHGKWASSWCFSQAVCKLAMKLSPKAMLTFPEWRGRVLHPNKLLLHRHQWVFERSYMYAGLKLLPTHSADHAHVGTDASLMCWTIVESGMYASAACLIGLRPLLKLLPEWIRKHTTKNDSRNTATRRSQRSGAIALADDQDSTSHFFRGRERVGGGTMELRSNGQDLESGRAESISSREIRVESEVKVASEGKDNYYPNYYPS